MVSGKALKPSHTKCPMWYFSLFISNNFIFSGTKVFIFTRICWHLDVRRATVATGVFLVCDERAVHSLAYKFKKTDINLIQVTFLNLFA